MAIFGKPLGELRTKSRILWEQKAGQMHWRNNLIVVGDRLYFSTSGAEWNVPDEDDAVWCADTETGSIVWRTPTGSDANSILIDDGVILVGTDGGEAIAINATTGELLSRLVLGSPVLAKPIRSVRMGRPVAFAIAQTGIVAAFDYEHRSWELVGHLPYRVAASPVGWKDDILVGTETNEVLHVSSNDLSHSVISRIPPHPKEYYTLYPTGVQSLVLSGSGLLVSYSRETYDERPPILCLEVESGLQQWHARGVKTLSRKNPVSYGNARTTPVVWQGLMLATFAYDDSLHAFDVRTGAGKWKVRLDEGFFQNWASPILMGHRLYTPRVNGVISTINLETQRLEGSLSVETANPRTSSTASKSGHHEFSGENIGLREQLYFGLASTPVIANDRMFVGTVAGRILCVSLN